MTAWASEELRHKIVRLRKQCVRPEEIAMRVNRKTSFIYKVLQKYALENNYIFPILIRKDCITEDEVRGWLEELQQRRVTQRQLAKEKSIAEVTMSRKINEVREYENVES